MIDNSIKLNDTQSIYPNEIIAYIDEYFNSKGLTDKDIDNYKLPKWLYLMYLVCKEFNIYNYVLNENNTNNSNNNKYDLKRIEKLIDMYSMLCNIYNKLFTLGGLSSFIGISVDVIKSWNVSCNRTQDVTRNNLYKRIQDLYQDSIDNLTMSGSIPVVYSIALKNNTVWKDNQVSALTGEQKRPAIEIINRYSAANAIESGENDE